MSNRNTGIGHIAARSLLAEIALLREDIHQQGVLLRNINLMLGALYCDMHADTRARLPLYTQPED
jgi:hypothetical protein